MKRITLRNEYRAEESTPFTCKVLFEHERYIIVHAPWMPKDGEMTLTKGADGVYENEHKVRYTKVTPDRRKKPFSVRYVSGIGEGSSETKFATLAEVQEYVKSRWQGVEYIDGSDVFHGDFGHFYLKGCNLVDLGVRKSLDSASDDFWSWIWKDFSPKMSDGIEPSLIAEINAETEASEAEATYNAELADGVIDREEEAWSLAADMLDAQHGAE
jgi:hypothetical protein